MVLECNPAHIIHEQIISTGRKLCIGHSVCYSLPVSGHYFVAYRDLPIRYLWIDFNQNKVTVYFADGTLASWTNTFLDAYVMQFGIAVSKDGRYVFVQTWENGLYCFSAKTGEKIWRTKSKAAVEHLYINQTSLCANRQSKKLQLVDMETGEVKIERKITVYEFFAVDCRRFLCRTTAKKWEIIDSETLETLDTFSADDRDTLRKWFSVFYG